MADLFTTDISGNVRPGLANTNIPFGGNIGVVNVRGVVSASGTKPGEYPL